MTSRGKPDLVVRWSKPERALVYVYQNNASKAIGGILAYELETRLLESYQRTLVAELADRGYDITTLRISIRKKAPT